MHSSGRDHITRVFISAGLHVQPLLDGSLHLTTSKGKRYIYRLDGTWYKLSKNGKQTVYKSAGPHDFLRKYVN
jgi:hypothetical protein